MQVNRNGVRAIAEGTGSLGGRFPVGYPVAEVTLIERDPDQAFARVQASPMAAMDRSRHLLLVFTERQ